MSGSRSRQLLFACKKNSELLFFSSPQPQISDENSSSSVVSNYRMKFSFNGNCGNIDCVNGLICLSDVRVLNGKKKTIVKIFNPSTGQVLILPKVKTHRNSVWSLFGYDPIGKQFKVLAMTKRARYGAICEEYQVLTLEREKMSWKMIECCIPHYPPSEKICINGVLYYTSIDWHTRTCTIVCFDIRLEKFNFVKTTGILKEAMLNGTIKLINYNGKLGLYRYYEKDVRFIFFNGRNITFKLWVLEDFTKQEWFEHTFMYPFVPRNIVGQNVVSSFFGVTQEKEIVFSSYDNCCPFYLYYLNFERDTFKSVEIQGIEACNNGIYRFFLDHVEDVKLYGKCLAIS